MFHGTSAYWAEHIVNNGQRANMGPQGSMGRGLYMSPDRETARNFAPSWSSTGPGAVVEGQLDDPKVYSLSRGDHYRQALRSGEGYTDPIMVEFDPKSRLAMVGEGNHRLRAAVQEGVSHVPVRATRSRIESRDNWDQGGRPSPLDPGPSPWKGGMGEEYWPSDIHPKYLWPSEDVR
jgi:hypothetical protein